MVPGILIADNFETVYGSKDLQVDTKDDLAMQIHFEAAADIKTFYFLPRILEGEHPEQPMQQ